MSKFLIVAAAAALATAGAASATTQLIVNGGFENTGFGGTGGYYNLGPAGSGADHTPLPSDFGFSVPVNNVDLIANGVYSPYLSTGGAYALDLVGYGSTGAISQTFATVAGKSYSVSVDYSENGSGKVATITADNVVVGTLAPTSPAFKTFTGSFVGTGAPVTFAITETVGGNSGGVVLDNVSVTVPEPTTWALFVAGFGLVGVAVRRRTTTVAA